MKARERQATSTDGVNPQLTKKSTEADNGYITSEKNFSNVERTSDIIAEKVGNKIAFNVVYSEGVAFIFSTVTVLATVKGDEWEL